MTSAPAIGFEYRPSLAFRQVLVLAALLAVSASMLSGVAWWLKPLLSIVVLLAAWRSDRATANAAVVAAGWGATDLWTIHLASHQDVPATLASFRVLGAFVLLRLKTAGQGTYVLLLASDNSDADIRRRLRMRLAIVRDGEKPAGA